MPDINGIPYVESDDLVSAYPAVSQSLAQELSDQLAAKLPYSYGTATPSTTESGFLWYDSNSTPAAPKFWDGAAFQALTSGKILQVVNTIKSNDSSSSIGAGATYSVPDLSVSITPSSGTSHVLISASLVLTGLTRSAVGCFVERNGTPIGLGDSGTVVSRVSSGFMLSNNDDQGLVTVPLQILDSPSTTSSVTYQVVLMNLRTATATVGVNRLSGSFRDTRMVSTITAMEVSA